MVEAAYVVDAPTLEWTSGLLQAAERSIGAGLGGFACGFRGKADGTISVDRASAAVASQTPETMNAIFDGLTYAPPGWLSSYTSSPRSASYCVMTSEVDPSVRLSYRARLARNGVHDGVNIACMDLERSGVLISLGVGKDDRLTAAIRHSLAKVGTHIAAALRLRERLRAVHAEARDLGSVPSTDEPSADGDAAAILSPEGKLLHADGAARLAGARRALQGAVRDIERARTSSRDDVQQALNLWKGLVSARWTLVDQFDAHGDKYIVARENPPRATALSKLTPTERCVVTCAARGFSTKEVAYTLGISDATVRVLLMRAARRCGVRGRRELLKLDPDMAAVRPGEANAHESAGRPVKH